MTVHKLTHIWQGITIDITHDDCWLNSTDIDYYVHHIAIKRRDEGQLPMTDTGYKSHFAGGTNKANALEPYRSALNLVKAWLDETGDTKKWKAYVASQKQLTLF